MQAYWLEEQRTIINLEEAYSLLKPNPNNKRKVPDLLKDNRHVQFLVHPYPLENDKEVIEFDPSEIDKVHQHVKVVLIKRNIVPKPNGIFESSGHRNILSSFVQKFKFTFDVLVTLVNNNPLLIPHLISGSMDSMATEKYINRSHEIFVMGYHGDAGFASEVAYPIQGLDTSDYTDHYITESINRIITVAQKSRVCGFQFHSSGFQVRFVNKSPCFLSMMNERNTMIIEYDMLAGTVGGHEIIKRLESEMFDLKGRPHWGLDLDWLNGAHLQHLYPNFDRWLKFYQNFNAKGTFNNSFTNRLGLWSYKYATEE